MSIQCPHCNFEIILTGVRPGRFSPKCQSCGRTFTLYVPPGSEGRMMVARSHVALHEMCLRMNIWPPKPYPEGVLSPSAKVTAQTRQLIGTAPAVTPVRIPPQVQPSMQASTLDLLGETDAIPAIEEDQVIPPPPSLKKVSRPAAPVVQPRKPKRAWGKIIRKFWIYRRFGTPLDWIFAPWLRLVFGLLIFAGFGVWWLQNSGNKALQQAAFGTQPAAVMTSHILELPLLPLSVRTALSGWNACLAAVLLIVSAFGNGRLFALAIVLAAAIAMIGYQYNIPQIGQPLPWMSAAAAGFIAFYAFIVLRRPEDV